MHCKAWQRVMLAAAPFPPATAPGKVYPDGLLGTPVIDKHKAHGNR